jgi:hypothetical protein
MNDKYLFVRNEHAYMVNTDAEMIVLSTVQ